jgi:hypothetical protein
MIREMAAVKKPAVFCIFLFLCFLFSGLWPGLVCAQQNLWPDLIVENLAAGAGNKLQVTLKNVGKGPLPKGWLDSDQVLGEAWFDSKSQGTFDLRYPTSEMNGGISSAGGTSVYLLAAEITQKTLVACVVDINGKIAESDEQNNWLEKTLWPVVVELPDLVIGSIDFNPFDRFIRCTVKNDGTGVCDASFNVSVDLNNSFYVEERAVTAPLKPGETASVTFSFPELPDGTTAIIVATADSAGTVKESNEQNNTLKNIFNLPGPTPTVSPKPTPSVSPKPTPTGTVTPTPSAVPSPTPAPTSIPSQGNVSVQFLSITKSPAVSQITADSAIVTWTTSHESDSEIRYGRFAGLLSGVRSDSQLLVDHRIVLGGLSPGTTYQFHVISRDAGGRAVQSQPQYFSTLPDKTTAKPSVTLSMIPELSGKKALIEADIKDSPYVDRVIFMIDGMPVFTDYGAPFEFAFDTTPFADGHHDFGARAVDAVGNVGEAAREAEIRNRFDARLTPVRVKITNPADGETVSGEQVVVAELEHDLGLDITQIEFVIDETVIRRNIYNPPVSLAPVLAPVYLARFTYNAIGFRDGEHVAIVRALDTAGNWGSDSCRFTIERAAQPSVSVSRPVVERRGNIFEITLQVQNNGAEDITGVTIETACQNLQCLPDARWRRDLGGDFAPILPEPSIERNRDNVSMSSITASLGIIRPGESKFLQFDAVPILSDPFDTWLAPEICAELTLRYTSGRWDHTETPDVSSPLATSEFSAAVQSSDYLIITCSSYLLAIDLHDDANDLLGKMGILARARNGVLGDISRARRSLGAASVRELLLDGGAWSSQMAPDWILGGYLLLVGESSVVPSFNVERVDLCDYPYSNTISGEAPELCVGRIIGNTAADLAVPIENSLRSVYNTRKVLIISGPEGNREPNVKHAEIGKDTLGSLGFDAAVVHAEYWTTEYDMFDEVLQMKQLSHTRPDLDTLAEFLLKKIGLPKGAAPETDLNALSDKHLITWLLWACDFLPDYPTSGNAMFYADDIIGGWTGNPMWSVLTRLLAADESERLLSVQELAAWVLWEFIPPRGSLTREELGSVLIEAARHDVYDLSLLQMIENADIIMNDVRTRRVKEESEAYQAFQRSRGGTYSPWRYIYCADRHAVEVARSQAAKALTAEGQDIICLYGHGDPGGLGGSLTDWVGSGSEIEPISLGGKNPVVMAFSCYEGFYEEGPQKDSSDVVLNPNPSISERFLQNGAAVFMGSTEMMLYAICNDLVSSLFWSYFPGSGSAGDSLRALKVDSVTFDPVWFHFKYYYNYYGDPKYGLR